MTPPIANQPFFDAGSECDPVMTVEDDPFENDKPCDAIVPVSRRGLCRLTLLAAELGARFQREGEPADPLVWLLTPQELFNGRAAIDACVQREHFFHALLLHGLAIGLDASPGDMEGLRSQGSKSSPVLSNSRRDHGGAVSFFAADRADDGAEFESCTSS